MTSQKLNPNKIMVLFSIVSKLVDRQVEGDPKAPFSLATPFGRGGRYFYPWFLHHLPLILPLSAECLAGGNEYQLLQS